MPWTDETKLIINRLREIYPDLSVSETDYGFTVAVARGDRGCFIQRAERPDRFRSGLQQSSHDLRGVIEHLRDEAATNVLQGEKLFDALTGKNRSQSKR